MGGCCRWPCCHGQTFMIMRTKGLQNLEKWVLQVALLSLDEDETELMDHLNAAKDVLGNPLYSPQFALRVARQRGSQRASVALLCQLNLLEVYTQHLPISYDKVLWQNVLDIAGHHLDL